MGRIYTQKSYIKDVPEYEVNKPKKKRRMRVKAVRDFNTFLSGRMKINVLNKGDPTWTIGLAFLGKYNEPVIRVAGELEPVKLTDINFEF